MYKPSSNSRQASLFWDLETMLDSKHPLFKLANMIDWSLFEKSFAPLFCADNGRPPKPIRLMTGLLMLKHLRNVSDEQVVVQFTENAYYQYFCGLELSAYPHLAPHPSLYISVTVSERRVWSLSSRKASASILPWRTRRRRRMTGIRERTVVDARATIVWDGTSTRVFSETL